MRIFPAIVAVGLTGVGYLYHQEQKGQPEPLSRLLSSATTWIGSAFEDDDSEDKENKQSSEARPDQESAAATAAPENDQLELADVFRFDVTPDNLQPSWKRVKQDSGESGLQGYRIPLATGNRDGDLTGDLTYYFDRKACRKITFTGTTADAGNLVTFLQKRFQYKRSGVRNGKVSTFTPSDGSPGQLRLAVPAKPDGRFQVDLSIER